MSKSRLSPNDPRHGTTNGYNNHKCRCQQCKAAWATLMRQQRVRRMMIGLEDDDPRHGRFTTYQTWGCRCERCKTAFSAYRKTLPSYNRKTT